MEQLLPAMVALGISSEKKFVTFSQYSDEQLRAEFSTVKYLSGFHKILLRLVFRRKAEKLRGL